MYFKVRLVGGVGITKSDTLDLFIKTQHRRSTLIYFCWYRYSFYITSPGNGSQIRPTISLCKLKEEVIVSQELNTGDYTLLKILPK